ncbi:MAG: NAD(+) synthase, partial [Selenomonadaceae bacterium]|nr:NAD(+) synthase [Selenomonadaceae bacterium]
MPKIAYAQMKVTAGHPDINTKKILHFIDEARSQGANLVVFPELAVSGLMLGDNWHKETFLDECKACGEKIIAASKDIVVVFGNILNGWMGIEFMSGLYNSIFVARDGELIVEPA